MSLRKIIEKLFRTFEHGYVTHNRIEVSASALRNNVDFFAKRTGMQVIPVLKGNAYGHGIGLVAEALRGVEIPYIAVDGYFEALRVREVTNQPVLVMGAILPENYARMRYDNFAFVVHDEASVHALGKTGKRIKVHLECNTGMNRYGARSEEITDLTKLILSYPNLMLEGVMSHLADSDGDDVSTIASAVTQFDACVEVVRAIGASPTMFHVAQSAGSVRATSKYANAMRLGIGLYGVNPFSTTHPSHAELAVVQPALRLVSTITKIISLKAGERVSYNYTFTAPHDMQIGVLPLGYYEGIPRQLSSAGVVKIGDVYAPIVGRVCMNHVMIGLDGIAAKVGDEVVVYSNAAADKNSIEGVAREHGLFTYALLTSLSRDIRRVLVR